MVICLERGADLHMAQLMPTPLTVSCFSKIQIGFTFLVPAHLGSPGQWAVKNVCVTYIMLLAVFVIPVCYQGCVIAPDSCATGMDWLLEISGKGNECHHLWTVCVH